MPFKEVLLWARPDLCTWKPRCSQIVPDHPNFFGVLTWQGRQREVEFKAHLKVPDFSWKDKLAHVVALQGFPAQVSTA